MVNQNAFSSSVMNFIKNINVILLSILAIIGLIVIFWRYKIYLPKASTKSINTGDPIQNIVFSPKDDSIAYVNNKCEVTLIKRNNYETMWKAKNLKDSYSFISYSPDGKFIALTGNPIRVWNTKTGLMKEQLYLKNIPYKIIFSPSGDKIAAACVNSNYRFYIAVIDVFSKKVLKYFPDEKALGFSRRFQSLSYNHRKIHLLDLNTGVIIKDFYGPDPELTTSVAFSSTSNMFVSGECLSDDSNSGFKIWGEKDENYQIIGSESGVHAVAISENSQLISDGNEGGIVGIWNLIDKSRLCKFHASNCNINTISFSYDGKLIASGDEDGMIKIWNINDLLR